VIPIALGLVLLVGIVVVLFFRSQPAPVVERPAPTPQLTATPTGPARSINPTLMPEHYVVADGDTLLDIALAYDVSTEALQAINDLANPDMLRAGQELLVPPASSTEEQVEASGTLRQIAAAHQLDPAGLAAYNGVPPERIDAPLGRSLVLIPDLSAPIPAPTTTATTPPATSTATSTYTVAEGDTISSIADDLGVDVDALIAANGLEDPDLISVGTELIVPTSE
jgi:LysM repeat protein